MSHTGCCAGLWLGRVPRTTGERRRATSPRTARCTRGVLRRRPRNPEQIPGARLAGVARRQHQHPDRSKDNGFFVVEADTKEGHGVKCEPRRHEATGGPSTAKLPDTRMAESPSGSIHRYFKHPGGDVEIKNSVSEDRHRVSTCAATAAW